MCSNLNSTSAVCVDKNTIVAYMSKQQTRMTYLTIVICLKIVKCHKNVKKIHNRQSTIPNLSDIGKKKYFIDLVSLNICYHNFVLFLFTVSWNQIQSAISQFTCTKAHHHNCLWNLIPEFTSHIFWQEQASGLKQFCTVTFLVKFGVEDFSSQTSVQSQLNVDFSCHMGAHVRDDRTR